MSPDLPQYTKSALDGLDGLGESEGLLRHHDEGEEASPTTYPPGPEASSSTLAVAPTGEPVKMWGLPPHLANYKLDGAFMLWTDKTAICGRANTRLETVDNLISVFPALSGRDPNTVQFKVACPPPAGSAQTSPCWSLVPESIWEEVVVRGRPDNLLVCVEVTKTEYRKQWIRGILVMGSPVWMFAIVAFIIALTT